LFLSRFVPAFKKSETEIKITLAANFLRENRRLLN
jgi:hypothetical protein